MTCKILRYAGPIILLAGFSLGCEHKSAGAAKKSESPANVPNVPKENQLNTFTLSPESEARRGIETKAIQKKPIVRRRVYGGEVVLPTGASLIVTAPLAGFLESPPKGGIPKVGETVKKGQPIFTLRPRLSADKDIRTPAERLNEVQASILLGQARIDGENLFQQAKVPLDKAKIDLPRA